jgi:asparagine synthase (glutamine-hydrolysing)
VLVESLDRRLRADVPVGLFLSSGVDSSLVAALAAKELGTDVLALTVGFADGADESQLAGAIASHLGLRHVLLDSRGDERWRQGPTLLRELYGVPNDNTTAISVLQLSTEARRHLTVALGGIGADELFLGYGRHAYLHRLARLPGWAGPVGPVARALSRAVPRLALTAEALGRSPGWQYLLTKNNPVGALLGEVPGIDEVADTLLPETGGGLVSRAAAYDLGMVMPGSYIPAIDRGSMRASVEVRTPFLSRALVDRTAAIDLRTQLEHGPKELLRRLLARYVPRELTDRPRQGFNFPTARMLAIGPARLRQPWAPPALVDEVWRRRGEPGCRALALRCWILHTFAADAAPKA